MEGLCHKLWPWPWRIQVATGSRKQIESHKRSQTGVAFAKSLRPTNKVEVDGVGPGEYALPTTIGKQTLSTVRSQPVIQFGKDKQRPDYSKDGNAYVPGPGQYKLGFTRYAGPYKNPPIISMSSRTKFGSVYG